MNSEFHLTECYCSFRMDKCFSSLQLIFPFIITGNLLTFCLFRLLIISTNLGVTWPNGIIWLTLVTIVKRWINQYLLWNQIMINILSFKHSGQFPSMQSFELELHVCVSTRSWAVGHNTSLNFKLEFIPFAKSEAFSQT